MRIRRATLDDADTICDFNVRLARESEGKTLEMSQVRPGVAAIFSDAAKGRYYVAEIDGRVVGQLAITFEWSDWRNGWIWWIQSVYVRDDARRLGVFRALFDHLQAEARNETNVIGIRLYVEDENRAAHSTYEKLGLKWTTYRVMEKYPLGK
jgi:GNAT superfamily N-acetyltransferase